MQLHKREMSKPTTQRRRLLFTDTPMCVLSPITSSQHSEEHAVAAAPPKRPWPCPMRHFVGIRVELRPKFDESYFIYLFAT